MLTLVAQPVRLVTQPIQFVRPRRLLAGLFELSMLAGIVTALAAAVVRVH